MHGTRDMDELGLETPFQDSREAEAFEASPWSGESPFAAENESLEESEGEDGESLDWLDYDSEASRAPQPCSCGAARESQFDESWSGSQDQSEDEAPRCWREDETPSEELEDALSPEHLEFRTKVFERVLRDRKHRKPFPDIERAQLDLVPRPTALPKRAKWTSVLTGKATAAAAGRLLEEAHQALLEAQNQGDADARRTLFIYPNSGYRSSAEQKKLWFRYFSRKRTGYYDLSADARSRLPGGPHSGAALDYMVKPKGAGGFGIGGRIAPPGYSNHQNAIALDFTQVRSAAKHRIPNSTAPKDDADRKWKASWFHSWLNAKGPGGQTNAARHGFSPIPTEAWHWEYRGQVDVTNVGTPTTERAPDRKATMESAPFGGRLLDFKANAHGGRVASFVPKAALGRPEVDVLFFVHGLLHVCKPLPEPLDSPVALITQKAFQLGKLVTDSGLPIVVVAPFFNWGPSAGRQPLASPKILNSLIQEVLDKVASSGSPVRLRRLVIAGHSRAFGILDPLANQAKSPEMERGALARLAEVWALDTSYGKYKNVAAYTSWLAKKPSFTLRVFYRPGSSTDGRDPKLPGRGHAFLTKRSPGRLEVVQCKESHCAVPVVRLPALLAGLEAKASEAEHDEYLTFSADAENTNAESDFETFADAEDFEPEYDEAVTAGEDEDFEREALDHESELERASDSEWYDSENEHDESGQDEGAQDEGGDWEAEGTLDEDEQESLEDEDEHGAWRDLLEDESAKGAEPSLVPKAAPIAFAAEPAPEAFWPIRTRHPKARVISYLPNIGRIVGNAGRAFLAKRSGTRNGVRTRRWHLGVDLFSKRNDEVFACEAGTIVGYAFFYKAKSGQKTYKILIAHEGSGVVVNYGEVRPSSLKDNGLEVGSRVRAGQRIGWVSDTDMIHFETYRPGTTDTARWWADQRAPHTILNPTRYLLALAQRGQPPEHEAGEGIEAREDQSSWEQQAEHEGSVADMVRNAASGIMQDYSLKGLADGKLGNIPKAIRDDVLSGRDRDLWKVANRVFWEKYPQLEGQKLDRHEPKHRTAIAEYGRIVVHVRALLWLCRIVQLLDKHRGNLPRAFLLGWMAKESDGRVSSTTQLREMGYFQIHPAEGREILKLTGADFERIGTDREHSIAQGVRLVQAHRKAIASNPAVPDPSDLLLRLTKARHGLPGLLKQVLTALKKEGKKLEWADVAARMRAAGDRGVVGNVEDTMQYASRLKALADRIPVVPR